MGSRRGRGVKRLLLSATYADVVTKLWNTKKIYIYNILGENTSKYYCLWFDFKSHLWNEGLLPTLVRMVWTTRNNWPGSSLQDHSHWTHEVGHAPNAHSGRKQFPHVHQRLLASISPPPPCLCGQKKAAAGHLKGMRRKSTWLLGTDTVSSPPPPPRAARCYSSVVGKTWPTAWSGLVPMKANSCPSRTL